MDLARPALLGGCGRVWKESMMGRNKGNDMVVVNNIDCRRSEAA